MENQDPYIRPDYPLLIVISGPSAVGKDTIARGLLEREPAGFHFVVTATDRAARPGEVHGKDYFFVSTAEFTRMIDEGELLEHAIVYNDHKGVPKQQIREALASGRDAIMRVDPQGVATIQKLLPSAVFIFLIAESEASMIKRLRDRKSETPEGLRLRTTMARQEMGSIDQFDYCVINPEGEPERAVTQILCIISAERARVGRQPIVL